MSPGGAAAAAVALCARTVGLSRCVRAKQLGVLSGSVTSFGAQPSPSVPLKENREWKAHVRCTLHTVYYTLDSKCDSSSLELCARSDLKAFHRSSNVLCNSLQFACIMKTIIEK